MKTYKAWICLFPAGQGGRDGDYRSNEARLGIKFSGNHEDSQFSAIVTVGSSKLLELGKIQKAKLQFANYADASKFIASKESFEIFEGARRIGVGTWK